MTQPDSRPPDPDDVDDPLAFTPVPRKTNRADGLHADLQQRFIQILAQCGSPRRAAAAVGKAANGFEQLRRANGAESFGRAWDAAIEIFRAEEARRCAVSEEVVRAETARWTPARGPWAGAASRAHLRPPPEPTEADLDAKARLMIEMLDVIALKYHRKLQAERRCRLAGLVAEADFYIRQVTVLEVALDVLSGDAMAVLRDFRLRGHDLLTIAETPVSALLDARRDHWRECGEPDRPEPPRHLFEDHGDFQTEPLEFVSGGEPADRAARQSGFDQRHAADAAAHIAWEARAQAAADAWRAEHGDPEDPIAKLMREAREGGGGEPDPSDPSART